MGKMLGFRSKYNDLVKGEKQRPTTDTREISPPSMSSPSSAESSPKTSIDEDSLPMTVSRIDFASEQLPEYDGMYAVLIDNVLSRSECATFLKDAEASTDEGWERALVNIGNGQQALFNNIRSCGRIIWDSQDRVSDIWDRVSDLPEIKEILRLRNKPEVTGNGPARRNETWEFTRPNERMRVLKYVAGEYFRPHCDGSYETPDKQERSYYTMHLYLNDQGPIPSQQLRGLSREERKTAQKAALQGGNTAFHSYTGNARFDVAPKAGSVLIFQHRDLLHSGTDVLHGTKYTMRTDLMFRRV